MFEKFYDRLQTSSGQKFSDIHNKDTDSFVNSIKTSGIYGDFYILKGLFVFSYINEANEKFTNENEKMVGTFKTET